VVAVKVEADGDLHIALRDATGDKPGIVVVEVPAKPQWCETRQTVFSWTRTRFPLHIHSTRTLNLGGDGPVVTVIGIFLRDYRRFEFHKRTPLLICTHNETLSVAMCVNKPDLSPSQSSADT
jgi:hypothetical protein